MNSQVPVLLFGSYITALGTMRSLARVGIRSYSVTDQELFVTRSRYYRRPPDNYRLISDPSDLRSYLDEFPLDKGILMPCSDQWIRAISELTAEETRFRWSLPSRELIAILVDKGKFENLLEEHGVDRPRTFLLSSETDIEPVFSQESADWFLKPADSQSFFSKYRAKAFRTRSIEEAKVLFNKVSSDGFSVVLQEYVSGPANAHFFVDGFIDRRGTVRAIFSRQRNRIYPPDFGDSSHMTSLVRGMIEPAEHAVTSLLSRVGYRGIFSAEFKYDDRDGRYKLLEINARPWAYIEFATYCGINMAQMACLDALDKDVPSIDQYSAGRSAIVMPNDYSSFVSQPKDQRPSLFSWIMTWISSQSLIFSWKDPWPAISRTVGIILNKVHR